MYQIANGENPGYGDGMAYGIDFSVLMAKLFGRECKNEKFYNFLQNGKKIYSCFEIWETFRYQRNQKLTTNSRGWTEIYRAHNAASWLQTSFVKK